MFSLLKDLCDFNMREHIFLLPFPVCAPQYSRQTASLLSFVKDVYLCSHVAFVVPLDSMNTHCPDTLRDPSESQYFDL